MLLGYNFMSTYGPQRRWRARLRLLAWVMGCSNTLTAAAPQLGDELSAVAGSIAPAAARHACYGLELPHPRPPRGSPFHPPARARSQGQPPLEELAASFAQFFGRVDLEKSDVLAGLVLAQIMQASERAAVGVKGGWQQGQPRNLQQRAPPTHARSRAGAPAAWGSGARPGRRRRAARRRVAAAAGERRGPSARQRRRRWGGRGGGAVAAALQVAGRGVGAAAGGGGAATARRERERGRPAPAPAAAAPAAGHRRRPRARRRRSGSGRRRRLLGVAARHLRGAQLEPHPLEVGRAPGPRPAARARCRFVHWCAHGEVLLLPPGCVLHGEGLLLLAVARPPHTLPGPRRRQ